MARRALPGATRITLVACARDNLAYQVDLALRHVGAVRDEVVWVGGTDRQRLRLIGVLHRGRWQRSLTNETGLERLPVPYAMPQRRRIEDAYALVTRLLGRAYFWSGSANAVQLQTYAAWILYAVRLDLGDAVATLDQPLAAISIDRLCRDISFFTVAYQAGTATDDVACMAAEAHTLGIPQAAMRTGLSPPASSSSP